MDYLRLVALSWVVVSTTIVSGCYRGIEETVSLQTNASPVLDHQLRSIKLPPQLVSIEGPVIEHSFVVQNKTNEQIQFKHVSTSCGCTEATLGKELLEPGEETTLELVANLAGRSGPQRFMCLLHVEGQSPWVYEVNLDALQRFEISPQVIQLGEITPNVDSEAFMADLIVRAPKSDGIPAVLGLEPYEGLDIDIKGPSNNTVNHGIVEAEYKLSIQPARQLAKSSSSFCALRIHFGESEKVLDGNQPFVRIAWTPVGRIHIDPRRLFFRDIERSGDTYAKAVLRSTDGSSFRIKRVESSHPAVTAKCDTATSATEHTLMVSIDPNKVDGRSLWGGLEVSFENDVAPSLRLPIAGFLKPG